MNVTSIEKMTYKVASTLVSKAKEGGTYKMSTFRFKGVPMAVILKAGGWELKTNFMEEEEIIKPEFNTSDETNFIKFLTENMEDFYVKVSPEYM